VPAIVERVKASHPYEVPGISSRAIIDGNPEYLCWILEETRPEQQ
jgi:periplasmic divalent cation tolerance protein